MVGLLFDNMALPEVLYLAKGVSISGFRGWSLHTKRLFIFLQSLLESGESL